MNTIHLPLPKCVRAAVFTLAALPILASAAPAAAPEIQGKPYLDAARRFADTVLDKGRDRYGEKQTPLFADGLHVETFEPATWIWKNDRKWVLSNFWNQQALMRLLDGLATATGEAKYRQAAEAAAGYMLSDAQSVSGLLFAGGHTAWDLTTDAPAGTFEGKHAPERAVPSQKWQHEMKGNQPYWELMWRVNPQAAKKAMRAVWFAHVVDWKTLDFNRHGKTFRSLPADWQDAWVETFDENIAVPYATTGGHLSFAGVVPPFLRAGVMLGTLADDPKAIDWSRRLATLWHRNRHPETGLAGGQISWRQGHDRAVDALAHAYPGINEATIVASYHMTGRYFNLPLAQMAAGEALLPSGGERAAFGRQLIAWAAEDLDVLRRQCWDAATGRFIPKLTDGTPIDPQKVKQGYYTPGNFLPVPPSAYLLWSYAKAYRLAPAEGHWTMLRNLGRRFGLGDFGTPDGQGRKLNLTTASRDRRMIYAMIELSTATRDREFLRLAARIGDNLVAFQHASGLFPRPAWSMPPGAVDHAFGDKKPEEVAMPPRVFARTSDEIPLALLHLAAAIDGVETKLPQAVTDSQYFHCPYKGPLKSYQQKWQDVRTYDWLVFYGMPELGSGEGKADGGDVGEAE